MRERMHVDGGVVVGYDGSSEAYEALSWAVDEARFRGLTLHVVRAWTITSALSQVEHPYGTVPSADELGQALERQTRAEIKRLDTTGVTVDLHVHNGPTSKTLLECAEEAELLVVGSRGRGGWAGLRLGSSAAQVVQHAACTVTVVRQRRPAD